MSLTRREFVGTVAGAAVAGAAGTSRGSERRERDTMILMPHRKRPGGVDYIHETVAGIEGERLAEEKALVLDGAATFTPPAAWWVVHGEFPPRGGRRDNQLVGMVALRMAHAAGKNALFREDDAPGIRPGVERQMLRHPIAPGAAFASFFHPFGREPGVYPGHTFVFSQAVLVPWDTLDAWFQDEPSTRGDREAVLGIDLAIAAMASARRHSFELVPNLVRHVGAISAVTGGPSWDFMVGRGAAR